MGILDIFTNKKSTANAEEVQELTQKLSLSKEEVHKVCLTKKPLTNLISRVGFCVDYSGSMNWQYKNGIVQQVLEYIFPIAMEFDDNASMEMWIFENGFHRLPNVTKNNIYDYVNREIIKKYSMGGTNYAPVMKDVYRRYVEQEPQKLPSYVVFITDGDNSDRSDTDEIIKNVSKYPIFWQFVGLGNASFGYLQQLDDMQDRYVDNADFFSVSNASDIKYENLLNEYPQWLENPKVKEMLSR